MAFDVESVADLAREIGVPGAALLILSIGAAANMSALAGHVRGIIKDFWDHRRKSRELEHRIERDSTAIGLEIARKREQVAERIERRSGK